MKGKRRKILLAVRINIIPDSLPTVGEENLTDKQQQSD